MTETTAASRLESIRPIEVLLVDDDETWARTQRRLLERHTGSLEVTTATSFADAHRRLDVAMPDCIVCDYQLGDGTGIDLLTEIRADAPTVPFILVTGEGTEEVASDAISAEVTDYVRKATLGHQPAKLATRIENTVRADYTRQALARERRSKQALLEMVTTTASRTDFGRQVCTHLVSEHGYACGWIGVLDDQQSIVPLSSAGATSYVEAAVEPGMQPATDDEPAFTALDESETVVRTLGSSGGGEPATDPTDAETDWKRVATDHGFETAVALPITHESDCFGVLCVYATNSAQVDESALSLLEDYAETAGYVFRITTWRQALLSSSPTMIEFTLEQSQHPLFQLADTLPDDATLSVRSVVPRTDTEVLYITDIESVSASDVTVAVTETDVTRSIEQYNTEHSLRHGFVVTLPSPERRLAELGAIFHRTVIEDRQVRLTVRVGTETAVRDCVEVLTETVETASITTRWVLQKQSLVSDTDATTQLTDRQKQALELAIEGGYFQRPRLNNTSELAAALGVSRATYTQHLRAAQQKVLTNCEWNSNI